MLNTLSNTSPYMNYCTVLSDNMKYSRTSIGVPAFPSQVKSASVFVLLVYMSIHLSLIAGGIHTAITFTSYMQLYGDNPHRITAKIDIIDSSMYL